MKRERKSLKDLIKESKESRFKILKRFLITYWFIFIAVLALNLIVIYLRSINPWYSGLATELYTSILMFGYHIIAIIVVYYDTKYWNVSKRGFWIIALLFLGPITYTIYYFKQKSEIGVISPVKEDESPSEYQESIQQASEETIREETEQEPEKTTLPEYHETLYAEGSATKKGKKDKETHSQRIWRDVNAIEERVDNIHKSKAKKPTSELNKTVDKILSKRKKK